jgi:hypothetical protein
MALKVLKSTPSSTFPPDDDLAGSSGVKMVMYLERKPLAVRGYLIIALLHASRKQKNKV